MSNNSTYQTPRVDIEINTSTKLNSGGYPMKHCTRAQLKKEVTTIVRPEKKVKHNETERSRVKRFNEQFQQLRRMLRLDDNMTKSDVLKEVIYELQRRREVVESHPQSFSDESSMHSATSFDSLQCEDDDVFEDLLQELVDGGI